MRTFRHALVGAAAHTLGALTGFLMAGWIMADSPARTAYALLSGWWCALWVGAVFRVRLAAVLPCALLAIGWGAAYPGHDLTWQDYVTSPGRMVGIALVFVSPIALNAALQALMARWPR